MLNRQPEHGNNTLLWLHFFLQNTCRILYLPCINGQIPQNTIISFNTYEKIPKRKSTWEFGAGDEARTRYLHLGKVALYRMSYTRISRIYYSTSCKFVKPLFTFP